jgi:molybdate transport system permease protein
MLTDWSPLWISLRVSGLATLVTLVLGTGIAYRMVGYRGRWRSLIDGFCLAPLVLPPTVVGFLLLQLFGTYGPVGALLRRFQVDIIFTWYAGAIAATVITFPLMYRSALGAFEQIDANLLAVARTLGLSEGQLFLQVVLPLALPGLLAGAILTFARGLGEFGATLMLAGNIPGLTTTIPIAIYAAVEAGDSQEAWVWSVVILAISCLAIGVANLWQFSRKGQLSPPSQTLAYLPDITQSAEVATSHLIVNIQKQLPNFLLQVNLQAGDQPIAILGESGSGKSMLLKCIAGMETPDTGQIILNGRALFDSDRRINQPSRDRHIGIVGQTYALFPHLTVAQNLTLGLTQKQRRSPATVQQVAATLKQINLSGFGDRYPHQLSGGQQQRVALARAFMQHPQILLLDEPFSALDTHLRHQMERELKHLLGTYPSITLMVTHNIDEAYRLCPQLLVLEQGRAIAAGPKQHLLDQPQTVTVAQLTGCKNISLATAVSSHTLRAIAWDCLLETAEPIPPDLTHVGFRAHHIKIQSPHPAEVRSPTAANSFLGWLAATSETPHRITLYLKLNTPANSPMDYHLQAELLKENWLALQPTPLPWCIILDSQKLLLLRSP